MPDPAPTPPAAGAVRRHTVRLASGLALQAAEPATPTHAPLLLLHGISAGAWNFDRYLAFFADRGWPTYALDLRGRPGSRDVADFGRVALGEYVEDALEAARHLGRPLVIGHSMGGLLAQKVAEADLARGVVLLCSMPPKGIRFARPALALRQLRHLPAMLLGRALTAAPADLEYMTLNAVPPAERAVLAARFGPESGIVARELSLGGLAVDAGRVRAPMVTISTTEDRFFGTGVGREIAARYHIPMWEYAGHGHFPVMEPGWERIAADIERWLAHTETLPARAAAYGRLWEALQRHIGDVVELTAFDGRRVQAELVNVDLARHRDVIHDVQAVHEAGLGTMKRAGVGETTRSSLTELVAMAAGADRVDVREGQAPGSRQERTAE